MSIYIIQEVRKYSKYLIVDNLVAGTRIALAS